jgi:hypothetical protein
MVKIEPSKVETESSKVETGEHTEGCRERQFAIEEFEGARLVAAFRPVSILWIFLYKVCHSNPSKYEMAPIPSQM